MAITERIRADVRDAAGDRSTGAYGVAAMVLATALGAQVSLRLPFTPVPFTLQVLAVLLTGLALSPRQALVAQATYAGAGLAGVPWFAGMATLAAGSGFVTIGYLAGFVAAAPLVAVARSRFHPLAAALAGVAVIHVAGASFLGVLLDAGPGTALVLGTWPFLPGDVLKALAAVAAARTLSPRS